MRLEFTLAAGLAAAGSIYGQVPGQARGERVIHDVVVAAGEAGPAHTMQFFSVSDFAAGAVVKGQPYSADSTTEMVRTLADGTRIVHKNTASMARDKEGRTRRDNTLGHIGPWATAGQEAPHMVTITDPAAKEVYLLDMNAKTYRKVRGGQAASMRGTKVEAGVTQSIEQEVHVAVKGVKVEPSAGTFTAAVPAFRLLDKGQGKKESLGRQMMEGVMVEGTRETSTIPVGEIGNDRAIVSTTERWYSPELQMEIYTKTVDPQFGESSYRIGNLRRQEPDAALFRVPGDFQQAPDRPMSPMRIMRKGPE